MALGLLEKRRQSGPVVLRAFLGVWVLLGPLWFAPGGFQAVSQPWVVAFLF